MDFKKLSTKKLLSVYAVIMNTLRERGVLRSYNNPVADYAEYIIKRKLNLKLTPNSNKEFDAADLKTGLKYQIKSRRLTRFSKSRQLGVIRNLEGADFDFLIAVIFDEMFKPLEIYQIPKGIIKKYARFSKHQNGHILILRGPVLKDKKVKRLK